MEKLSGPISDRLRQKLPADDPSWNPGRGQEPKREIEKNIKGHSLGRGANRKS